ncbi:MAG: GspH/FimT family pseudopilin [Steroidobacteraceae bacterium]
MEVRQTRHQGFTLIELMITISITAVLLSMAVPSFTTMRQNSIRRSALNDYWHAIFLARNEAIKRNSVVVLCKSDDGQTCQPTATDWSRGWLVFDNLDHDEPAQRDDDEPVLKIYPANPKIDISSNRVNFSFRPVAQGAVNGTIVFCDSRGSTEARAIIISHTGRPRQSNRDASNRALTCPVSSS